MGFLQNLEHLASSVSHGVTGAAQDLEHAVGIGNQPQQRIIEDPIGPQLQQQLQNLPRYAQMPHTQILPYMGSNGQPEPTTQQVAPNSVLNHPQVNQPSFIQQLMSILHGSSQPDITYNPNPNTNIPYSAHSVGDARLGNQYVQNPTSPQFIGVDPARFGFPPDNTMR